MTSCYAIVIASLMSLSCCAATEPAFQLRSIYSPTNALEEIRGQYATQHVDYDWDLWGHNLRKIVGRDAPRSVYATVADTLCRAQFCFSSEKLYSMVEAYILDQYGEGTAEYSARICIMPQDNRLACTCRRCVMAGNGVGNATPAVTRMLSRLARRFPRHQFFTSSYHSTRAVPQQPLPENVGVFVSAIDLQLRYDFSRAKGYDTFVNTVKQWRGKTRTLYVWDYERNYEDYLSPFPCLYAMQARLKLYRELGVDGVFVNGSGDEYSSFDDMQTVVLAQLLQNPDLDIDAAVSDFYDRNYPETAALISDYYLGLEHRTLQTNHLLPLYGSMEEMCESYLDAEEFTQWRKALDRASKDCRGEERSRLNYLLTALSFTQLQLLKTHAIPHDAQLEEDMREVLSGHRELKGMEYYSETYLKIDDYLNKK